MKKGDTSAAQLGAGATTSTTASIACAGWSASTTTASASATSSGTIPDLRNTVTDLLIGDLFDDKVDKVWKPMESLYPADKKRLPTWEEGVTPDEARHKANELVLPEGPPSRRLIGVNLCAIYKRRVEFAETDMAGMVHFSMFFRYMEEAEHAIWRKRRHATSPPKAASTSGRAFRRTVDFKNRLKVRDEFEVRTEMAKVSPRTIQWAHTLMRGDTLIAHRHGHRRVREGAAGRLDQGGGDACGDTGAPALGCSETQVLVQDWRTVRLSAPLAATSRSIAPPARSSAGSPR